MDTTRNRWIQRLLRPVALVLLSTTLGMRPSETPGPSVAADTPRERELATWVLARYRSAGLELPAVEIEFHPDPSGCRDNSGFYRANHLDVCIADQADAYARRVLVHELAHAWSESSLTAADRARFLRLRGLDTWNSWDEPWGARGFEQAAEVLTWGVGDGATRILLPDHDDAASLTRAYLSLTGLQPPAHEAGATR
jgi:hypothetical protein